MWPSYKKVWRPRIKPLASAERICGDWGITFSSGTTNLLMFEEGKVDLRKILLTALALFSFKPGRTRTAVARLTSSSVQTSGIARVRKVPCNSLSCDVFLDEIITVSGTRPTIKITASQYSRPFPTCGTQSPWSSGVGGGDAVDAIAPPKGLI